MTSGIKMTLLYELIRILITKCEWHDVNPDYTLPTFLHLLSEVVAARIHQRENSTPLIFLNSMQR